MANLIDSGQASAALGAVGQTGKAIGDAIGGTEGSLAGAVVSGLAALGQAFLPGQDQADPNEAAKLQLEAQKLEVEALRIQAAEAAAAREERDRQVAQAQAAPATVTPEMILLAIGLFFAYQKFAA